MTKHLRFLIVLLLTLVWSAGWAQTTIDFSNGLPTGWSNTGTIQKQTIDNKACSQLQTSASITSPAFEDAYSSMKISLTRSSRGTTFTISYQVGNASAVEIKTFKAADVTEKSWKDYIVNIPATAQVANCKFIFKSTKASYYISSIEFTKAGPSKTPTKVAFPAEYSNKTFTFTEGKLEGFIAPTATETNNVAGTINYSSNNVSAVKVNASTGALSFPGYGEATITATFTPNDAEKYAVSTDSYKVVNKADLGDFVFYESFDKCDGVEGWSGNVASKTWDDTVFDNIGWTNTGNAYLGAKCIRIGKKSSSVTTPVISFTSDAMLTFKSGAWQGDNTEITITVSDGTLIYGDNAPAKSVNIKLIDSAWNTYSMKISGTKSCKITFKNKTTSYRFFLDEVMVKEIATPTVENITLNESATNTLEAKTGVNVTLKRSMVVNEWNTICLPFNVTAEQAKTAFGEGVMIAQLNKNSSGNKLSFSSVDAIVASTPYLIKPTIAAPADGYKFEGVTIRPDGKGNVAPNFVNTNSYLAFVGIYNTVDVTNNVIEVLNNNYYAAFLGANNTIFKAKNDGGKMKGFRAYFAIPNNVAASALCVMVNGTTTSIKSINGAVVESNAPVYNLQGQRVDGNNLTPGIYIKAGKKFVVR